MIEVAGEGVAESPARSREVVAGKGGGVGGRAIILARIRRDLTPFNALVVELGPLLDAAAPRTAI